MTPQRLDRLLHCYRIGDPYGRFPILDATGSRYAPGRWNRPDTPVLYTSEHFATALLEKLVHGAGELPPNQHSIEITVPRGTTYEMVTPDMLPGWDRADRGIAQAFGAQWAAERRSLLLIVPSVVARVERNVLLNPQHEEFATIEHSLHIPVYWDSRLLGPR